MVLFENIHYDKVHDEISANLTYEEVGLSCETRVSYKGNLEELKVLDLDIQGFHRRQIHKAIVDVYMNYIRGNIREGGKKEVAWG